jgi:hypothetical protein
LDIRPSRTEGQHRADTEDDLTLVAQDRVLDLDQHGPLRRQQTLLHLVEPLLGDQDLLQAVVTDEDGAQVRLGQRGELLLGQLVDLVDDRLRDLILTLTLGGTDGRDGSTGVCHDDFLLLRMIFKPADQLNL